MFDATRQLLVDITYEGLLLQSSLSGDNMQIRTSGDRLVVAVGACVVLCTLLTLLIQHRTQENLFKRFPETEGRNAVKSSDQLPFISVIVVATSAIGWLDRRARIRTQFPRNMDLLPGGDAQVALLKFAIGTHNLADDQLSQARTEAGQFLDILLLDCLDEDNELKHPHLWRQDAGVSSTTSKVMLSVQWAVRHYDFLYYFRLGDDSYFRIDKFVSMLSSQSLPLHNAVVGHIMTDRLFGMDQLYPQGMGYGLTHDICKFIATNHAELLNTAPEDCVVARWLFALGTQFVNSPLFLDIHMGDTCTDNMVLAHKLPAELWLNISEDGTVSC